MKYLSYTNLIKTILVYWVCLFFVHYMLTNGDFNKFNSRIPDENIFKCRKYFFDDINGIYD